MDSGRCREKNYFLAFTDSPRADFISSSLIASNEVIVIFNSRVMELAQFQFGFNDYIYLLLNWLSNINLFDSKNPPKIVN